MEEFGFALDLVLRRSEPAKKDIKQAKKVRSEGQLCKTKRRCSVVN